MNRTDDKALNALLEQAEIITRAWVDSLQNIETQRGNSCLPAETIERYVAGDLKTAEASGVLDHLGSCAYCRKEFRRWRLLRDAEVGEGTCDLNVLREMMRQEPDIAVRPLARVSRRIANMVLSAPPEQATPYGMDAAVYGSRGETLGKLLALSIERAPRIDSDYQLILDIKALESSCEGSNLLLFLKSGAGKIGVGSVTLKEGAIQAVIDLSDLNVRPGFLPFEAIDASVVYVQQETKPASGDLLMPGQIAKRASSGRTKTSTRVAGVPSLKEVPVSAKEAPQETPAERKSANREGE